MKKPAFLALTLAAALALSGCSALNGGELGLFHHQEENEDSGHQSAEHDSDISHQGNHASGFQGQSMGTGETASESAQVFSRTEDYDTAFSDCLGRLSDQLSPAELQEVQQLFDDLWELRSDRLSVGLGTMTSTEKRAMQALSEALDDYTQVYFGDYDAFFGEEDDPEEVDFSGGDEENPPDEIDLVDFPVNEDGTLGTGDYYDDWDSCDYTESQLIALWDTATALLPEEALAVFDTYTVFTDGEGETLGYVYWDFVDGDLNNVTWSFALDPADSDDQQGLQETLLHEYFHYISLNNSQVDYQGTNTGETYAEDSYEIYSHADSYLNQFYQTFWPSILTDERLANPESEYYFLRHYDEYYDSYATTDPSEDIAECFSIYVLWDDGWYEEDDLETWEKKIAWFDQFYELREFRAQVRARLGQE